MKDLVDYCIRILPPLPLKEVVSLLAVYTGQQSVTSLAPLFIQLPDDNRQYYVNVWIFNIVYTPLLDTGANISVVDVEVLPLFSDYLKSVPNDNPVVVITTDGYLQNVTQVISIPVTFNDLVEEIKFFYHPFHNISWYYLRDGLLVKLVFKDKNMTPVLYAIKHAVEEELKRLVNSGVLKPVTSSEWASPVVVVSKPDGPIRISANFKITINRFLSKKHYPLPNSKDIYAFLAGEVVFTFLDLSEAYLQLPVHKGSQPPLTINTHVGLIQYQRLTFGVAPGLTRFQEVMNKILIDLDGISYYLDNILIAGKSRVDFLKKTLLVLQKLQKHNINVCVDKCDFFVPELRYLGHIIDKNEICPDEELLKAIKFAPRPTNKTELKSYLGLINFYCHFVRNLSGKLVPLYELTKEDANLAEHVEKEKAATTPALIRIKSYDEGEK
ncbi:hypothetical protein ILUMI_26708, partial [Ignelater luminosus]